MAKACLCSYHLLSTRARYILDNQRDLQQARQKRDRDRMRQKFDNQWKNTEYEMVMAAREEKLKYIKNREKSRKEVKSDEAVMFLAQWKGVACL